MRTYYGTFTDINESDIIAIYNNYKFYFTSNFNKTKFIENVDYYVNLEEIKFNNKYGLTANMKDYFSIWYYKKVQKRGTRIEYLNNKKKINDYNFIMKIIE